MKEKLYYLLSICAVAIFVGGCLRFPIYKEDLDNGYIVVAKHVMQDARILCTDPERPSWGRQVVPRTVF
jgi:hypothetical protein